MDDQDVNFEPGDTVAIVEHRWAPQLYPDRVSTVPASDGWVIARTWRVRNAYSFVGPELLYLLKAVPGQDEHTLTFVAPKHARLVAKGPGRFIPGASLPFSPFELRRQRFEDFVVRLRRALTERGTVEGWCNPATHQAYLLLRNDSRFMLQSLPRLRRKDGSVNLQKLQQEFARLGLRAQLDPDVYAMPIDVPDEFAHHRTGLDHCLAIQWQDIEQELRGA